MSRLREFIQIATPERISSEEFTQHGKNVTALKLLDKNGCLDLVRVVFGLPDDTALQRLHAVVSAADPQFPVQGGKLLLQALSATAIADSLDENSAKGKKNALVLSNAILTVAFDGSGVRAFNENVNILRDLASENLLKQAEASRPSISISESLPESLLKKAMLNKVNTVQAVTDPPEATTRDELVALGELTIDWVQQVVSFINAQTSAFKEASKIASENNALLWWLTNAQCLTFHEPFAKLAPGLQPLGAALDLNRLITISPLSPSCQPLLERLLSDSKDISAVKVARAAPLETRSKEISSRWKADYADMTPILTTLQESIELEDDKLLVKKIKKITRIDPTTSLKTSQLAYQMALELNLLWLLQ